jgi:hypothetical protein
MLGVSCVFVFVSVEKAGGGQSSWAASITSHHSACVKQLPLTMNPAPTNRQHHPPPSDILLGTEGGAILLTRVDQRTPKKEAAVTTLLDWGDKRKAICAVSCGDGAGRGWL